MGGSRCRLLVDLADRADVSLRTVQNFEGRIGSPTPANLRALLDAVDIDPEDTNGDDVAEHTWSTWPADVRTFLFMLGAYLVATYPDEGQRMGVEEDLTRQIYQARHR